MNVLQNLMELYNQLPPDSTYRVVIKGILENMNFASDATIYDVAELTDSSRTTVWRMVQKMGYKNYSDFRYALKAAVSQYTYYNRIISSQVDTMSIVSECVAQIKAAGKIIEKNINPIDIQNLARKIHGKKQIRFYLPFSKILPWMEKIPLTSACFPKCWRTPTVWMKTVLFLSILLNFPRQWIFPLY